MFKRINAWLDQRHFVTQIAILLLFVFVIRTCVFGLYQVPSGSMETTMLVGERFIADKFTPWVRKIKRVAARMFGWGGARAPLFKRGDVIAFNDPTFAYSKNPLKYWWQRYVWGPGNWTKRVIGVPGDRVEGRIENGKPVVYINGELLHEPYVNKYPLIYVLGSEQCVFPSLGHKNDCLNARSYDPNKPLDEQPFYKMSERDLVKHPYVPSELVPGTPRDAYFSYPYFGTSGSDVYGPFVLGPNEYWVMGDNRLGSYDVRCWGKPLKEELIHGIIIWRLLSIDSSEGWLIWDLVTHPISFWSKVRWNRCCNVVR
ncbi:MAG: signal peptidase I [Candidatus Babeliaceae bacterium]|nr:signal peptidase I [Candidatus Babeliaceae bacterium]